MNSLNKAKQVEQWLPIPGHEGRYEVSNMGAVRSIPFKKNFIKNGKTICLTRKGTVLKKRFVRHGYIAASIYCLGVKRPKQIAEHRLVAMAWCPNPNGYKEVNHKNGNKADNRAENLEWVSRSENMRHSILSGFQKRRLTETQIKDIRASKEKHTVLARHYGVSDTLIRKIRNHERYLF